MSEEQPDLLIPAEAAIRLRTGRNYVYRRIADGSLPVINIGTEARPKFRIRATDLQAFIDGHLPHASPT